VLKTTKLAFNLLVCSLSEEHCISQHIKVIFLPADCASHLQPLDLGIIYAFKHHYRKQLFQKAVAMIDGGLLQDFLD
jgi:hypothetical protein